MNLRQILNNSKIGLLEKINFIKTQIDPGSYNKIFESNRILRHSLNRNLFPKNLENIKVNDPLYFTNDFVSEFQWVANKILLNVSDINQFVVLKEEFEISILKGDFPTAKSLISQIVSNYGFSIWSIESELHISEEEIGSSENWLKLSNYLNIIGNNFYEFCINASSKKIENSVSFESYVNQIQNDINTINANELIKDFFVFSNFVFANYNYYYSDLRSAIYICNLFSIIDQYNNIINVITVNLNNKNCEYRALFKSFVSKLIKAGNSDIRVINIYNHLWDEKYIENKNWTLINEILEIYYKGDFKSSLKLSKIFIIEYPLEFEVYEIYIKSIINLKQEFEPLGLRSIDLVLMELYQYLLFKKNNEKCGRKLIKYALKYSNGNLGMQIMDFLSNIDNNKNQSIRYSFYSNSYKVALEGFNSAIGDLFGNNNYFEYKKILYGLKDVEYSKFVSTDNLLKLVAEVAYYYYSNNYSSVISLVTENFSVIISSNYYKERFLFFLFDSYIKDNKIEEALDLFGYMMFDEDTFYIKTNFQELFELAIENDDKFKFISSINTLILSSLYYFEYNLYEFLDEFLCSRNYDLEDVLHLENLDPSINVYLLNKICTIDTIKYYFNRINDTEEFRSKVLFRLITIDKKNKKIYSDEIDEINKKISVRNVIKEVNNGRLFVDIDRLKEQLVEKYNDDFNRLLRIATEKKSNKLVSFNASKARNWETSLKEQVQDDFNNYNDADFVAFKNIYYEVREQFLFSKEYGLDSSLSTKIRHGALENQIRSVFEKLNLVTTKLSGEYIDSEYWNSQKVEPDCLETIQIQIKVFSKQIDDLTGNLKNHAIQITHERLNNPIAVFNYSTNDEILYNFYKQHIDYLKNTDDIVEILLNDLAYYTNLKLCIGIYEYLENEVYQLISDLVENFRNSLPKSLPRNIMLYENLNTSLTNLQLCLEDVSEWFILETSSTSKLLMLEDIINASVEITKQLNISITVDYEVDMKFKSVSGYSSLIYVFNILFTNAIIHSQSDNKIKLTVKSELIDGQYIKIDVINTHNIKDLQKTKDNLKIIKDNWNDLKKIERSNIEGESGFHKIKRIMIYEAKCITEKFDYEVNSENITISLFLVYKKPDNHENINY